MTAVNDGAALLGRVLLAVIFVLGGFQKLFDFAGTIGYMKAEGLTLPTLAAIIAILVECVGGVLVIAGYQRA
jgi:putative oxidoreductase